MARGRFGTPDFGKPMVCRKAFLYNGTRFQPGEPFDWRRRAVPHRKVMQLLNSSYIAYEGDPRRDPNVAAGKTKASTLAANQRGSRGGRALRAEGAAPAAAPAPAKKKKKPAKKKATKAPEPAKPAEPSPTA